MTSDPDGRRRRARSPTGRRGPSLRRRLSLLFVLAAVVVALVVTVATVSLVHLTDTRQALITQIDPASLAADQLLEAYLDEETGVRGYILSRNAAFAQPYVSGNQRPADGLRPAGRPNCRAYPHLLALAERGPPKPDRTGTSTSPSPASSPPAPATRSRSRSSCSVPARRGSTPSARGSPTLDAALSAERADTGAALSDATDQLIAALVFGLRAAGPGRRRPGAGPPGLGRGPAGRAGRLGAPGRRRRALPPVVGRRSARRSPRSGTTSRPCDCASSASSTRWRRPAPTWPSGTATSSGRTRSWSSSPTWPPTTSRSRSAR